jgi:two-component system NtrC family sensor kinase
MHMTENDDIQHQLLNDDKMDTLIDHALWSKHFIKNNIRVLLVDDMVTNIVLLKHLIEINKGTAYLANNGKEAVEVFQKNSVDIILMDLHMPVMNGFEATYKIKALSGDNFTPIVICSAYAQDEIIAKAQACGADDILEKPFSHGVFYSKINSMIRLKEFYDKEKAFAQQLQKEVYARNQANAQLIEFQKQLEDKVEQKTALLRQKDLELLEMDRIASINTLAAGMAHEINNPLGFIKSSVDSLSKLIHSFIDKTDCPDQKFSNRTDTILIRINKGIKRISQIINSLRNISNVNRSYLSNVNLNQSIQDAIELLQSNEEQHPTIITKLSNLPEFNCCGVEIHLCIMNVIKNAIDAVQKKEKGELCITSHYDEKKAQIVICVKDNGEGMSSEIARRAFDPFYTTRPVGQGTGVGLSLTEQIVKRYGGSIFLESQENEGTAVTITLPGDQVNDKKQ